MLDKALEFGAGFDWFTPLTALVMQSMGKWSGMSCPLRNVAHIDAILRKKKLKMRAVQVNGSMVLFCVPANQIRLHRSILKGLVY